MTTTKGSHWNDGHYKLPEHVISVEPFRRRLLELTRMGITVSELCRRIDWEEPSGYASTSRLTRMCGVAPYHAAWREGPIFKKWISRDNAALMCQALNLDPADVGL